jgi:hypothetical protein
MAVLTTAQEYEAVRATIQSLVATGRSTLSFSVGGIQKTYEATASQLPILQAREIELANRMCQRNRRKRTSPDFSYDG